MRLECAFRWIPIGFLALAAAASNAQPISTAEAARHIGETRTVCGRVASARWDRSSKHQPTFLNLDKAYPDQPFTIVIWAEARRRFPFAPEGEYRNKKICVKGKIQEFRGKPEVEVDQPAQIWIVREP